MELRTRVPLLVAPLVLAPVLMVSGAGLFSSSPIPPGLVPHPAGDAPGSEGGLLIAVTDGAPRHVLLDPGYIPRVSRAAREGATLLVRTGPMSTTGPCVRELGTGVPNRPIDESGELTDYYGGDRRAAAGVLSWLAQDRVDIALVHFNGVDHAGHLASYRHPEYRGVARGLDRLIGELLDAVPADWTVMITPDHALRSRIAGVRSPRRAWTRSPAWREDT